MKGFTTDFIHLGAVPQETLDYERGKLDIVGHDYNPVLNDDDEDSCANDEVSVTTQEPQTDHEQTESESDQ